MNTAKKLRSKADREAKTPLKLTGAETKFPRESSNLERTPGNGYPSNGLGDKRVTAAGCPGGGEQRGFDISEGVGSIKGVLQIARQLCREVFDRGKPAAQLMHRLREYPGRAVRMEPDPQHPRRTFRSQY